MSKNDKMTKVLAQTFAQTYAPKPKLEVEYEIFLRHGSESGEFYVDVREDIVDANGDITNGGEYIEGFIFDHWNPKESYAEAATKFFNLKEKYPDAGTTDEVAEEASDFLSIRNRLNP